MKAFLTQFLESGDKQIIEKEHQLQKKLYGVYQPPSLKQLISLRHLLISVGILEEIESDDLLGLSKIQCKILLNKLNHIYISRRKQQLMPKNNAEGGRWISRSRFA